jgi:hypothetical protein
MRTIYDRSADLSNEQRLAQVSERAAELAGWLDRNVPRQATEPDGGLPGIWRDAVSNLVEAARRELVGDVARTADGLTLIASSQLPGYLVAPVLTSDLSGKGWGRNGGWCETTRHMFPDTLKILFEHPRELHIVDFLTSSDNWKKIHSVTAETDIGELGLRAFDVEVKDTQDGNWIQIKSVVDNDRVWVPIDCGGREATGVRFICHSSRYGYSTIVHVDLEGKFSRQATRGGAE